MPVRKRPLIVELDESDKDELIGFYLPKYIEAEELRLKAEEKSKSLKKLLEQFGYDFDDETENVSEDVAGEYNPKWTWIQKIQYILSDGQLAFAEIISKIQSFEPGKEKQTIVRSTSGTLSTNSKTPDSVFRRTINDRGEYRYELNKNSSRK
jgi:2-methylaconitate cis-trans-isomerase PrpF